MDLFDLIDIVDEALLTDMREGPHSGYLQRLFQFFDSMPDNPLTPREFYQFLGSLTAAEQDYFMLALD